MRRSTISAAPRIARNGTIADGGQELRDGDELSLLPPAGADDRFAISARPLNAGAIEALVRDDAQVAWSRSRASCARRPTTPGPFADSRTKRRPRWPSPSSRRSRARRTRFGDCSIAIHHRVGDLAIGEIAVVV